MKTLVLTGIRKMEMTERPKPLLKNADDVLIRIKTVGVCGSDIHYFTEGKIGTQVVEFPFAVGHECSGIIEEVGSSVTRVKPGDLVAVDPSIHCGTCDRRSPCPDQDFLQNKAAPAQYGHMHRHDDMGQPPPHRQYMPYPSPAQQRQDAESKQRQLGSLRCDLTGLQQPDHVLQAVKVG